jgi:hypothetical protein
MQYEARRYKVRSTVSFRRSWGTVGVESRWKVTSSNKQQRVRLWEMCTLHPASGSRPPLAFGRESQCVLALGVRLSTGQPTIVNRTTITAPPPPLPPPSLREVRVGSADRQRTSLCEDLRNAALFFTFIHVRERHWGTRLESNGEFGRNRGSRFLKPLPTSQISSFARNNQVSCTTL